MASNFSSGGWFRMHPKLKSLVLAFSHPRDVMTVSYVSLFIYIYKINLILFMKGERYLVKLNQSKHVHLCEPIFA